MKCQKLFSLILSAFLFLIPAFSLAEEIAPTADPAQAVETALATEIPAAAEVAQVVETNFHIDFPAFVDSLQYMLKGLVGIFLVTGLIILVLVILEKGTKGKQEE